ncbi:uncharacterized protein BX664DRAFT_355829 [Halteromyces radiatus]|uniref:uncharacterized protein n=1 Tax=Halteromyces radiatus TaxID=101107 RepID=UPI00221F80D0|nr:uncharacterized protein BX664DRAFT_355829 [Halteromyces radiatus]KAI8096469.1 hypothetical protein BX664DRAFT_355829 [Halteromyces radiatus]
MYFENGNRRNTMISAYSSSSQTSIRIKLIWRQVSNVFRNSSGKRSSVMNSNRTSSSAAESAPVSALSLSSSSSSSLSTRSSMETSPNTSRANQRHHHVRKKQWIDRNSAISDITIPPFSPTYCKPNEFPYSNFYIKLPNGKWMVRYRSGNRDILRTDQFEDDVLKPADAKG